VQVRLTPKGGRDALENISAMANGQEVVRARVRAAPEDGAANAALIGLMAEILGVAKSDTIISAGLTARLKTMDIRGDGKALAVKLNAALKD
jgi:uncharacterized protein YggU (UPF0235/DUF167 family)